MVLVTFASDQGYQKLSVTREQVKLVATAERWRSVCKSLGVMNGDKEHPRILRGWSSMGRHDHTVEHLAACLLEIDGARTLAQRPAEVELARLASGSSSIAPSLGLRAPPPPPTQHRTCPSR